MYLVVISNLNYDNLSFRYKQNLNLCLWVVCQNIPSGVCVVCHHFFDIFDKNFCAVFPDNIGIRLNYISFKRKKLNADVFKVIFFPYAFLRIHARARVKSSVITNHTQTSLYFRQTINKLKKIKNQKNIVKHKIKKIKIKKTCLV